MAGTADMAPSQPCAAQSSQLRTGYTVPFWRTEHRGGAPELSAPVFTTHKVGQRIVVCLERESRRTEDGILILPAAEFCVRLGAGDLF